MELTEVREAAIKWSSDIEFSNRNGQAKTVKNFTYVAIKWLCFNGMFTTPTIRVEPDDSYAEEFVHFIQIVRGLSQLTVRAHRLRIRAFLRWNTGCSRSLTELTLGDVDAYVMSKLRVGHKPTYIASVCGSLRLFLQFAEAQEWNMSKIAEGVHRPRIPRVDSERFRKDLDKLSPGREASHWKDDANLMEFLDNL